MKFSELLFACFLLFGISAIAQENFPPDVVIFGTFKGKTVPLRELATQKEKQNLGIRTIKIVYNNIPDNLDGIKRDLPVSIDRNVQRDLGAIQTSALEENFNGSTYTESGSLPPDPTGSVGPNHYVHAVNSIFKVFSKTGEVLAGPITLMSFFGGNFNYVDPIVTYDQLADRWLISAMGTQDYSLFIGVSETNDPTGAYYMYQFDFDALPDYPKYSVWNDAYYLTLNTLSPIKVYALDRKAMLAGIADPAIVGFSLPGLIDNTDFVFSAKFANLIGPTYPDNAPGYVTHLQDDGWDGVAFDHLKVWEINMDWGDTDNSTISAPLEIPTSPFNTAFSPYHIGNIEQPGTDQKLSMWPGIVSYNTNYRSFEDHNSWVITFETDVDNNDTSGIRWIELRNDATDPWSIYQEGTYAPADGHSRFFPSSGMDAAGNIGLAYNIGSGTRNMGISYTGRFEGDPLGQMTVAETEIFTGDGVQSFTSRIGDYSHLTMDPDNFTFWFTGQYFSSENEWATRIASFKLSNGFENDVGISNVVQPENRILTNAETVEVNIRNYGTETQTNIPLELRLDGIIIASETYTGSIEPTETVNYTFSQTVDLSIPGQTYAFEARTNLPNDEFPINDPFIKSVKNIFANDVGVSGVTTPESGPGLGIETIIVTIKNHGVLSQSNFDVQYVIDGGTPVVQTFAGPIESEQEMIFNFTQPADFSALRTYNLTVSTSLPGDEDASNDAFSIEIENRFCQPSIDCGGGNGFRLFSIAEIHNPSECEGYADFTHLVANLEPDSTNDLTVTTKRGKQFIKVWIDFNDDSVFTADEVVVDNYQIAPGQGVGTFTETMDLVIPANANEGMHIMRAKSNFDGPVPDNACEITARGETEDYTANIGSLGIDDYSVRNGDLIITTEGNKQFGISLTTTYTGRAYIAIYNVLGQQLKMKTLSKTGDSFKANLDMSEAASGVYIVKLGGPNTKAYQTGRFIVE